MNDTASHDFEVVETTQQGGAAAAGIAQADEESSGAEAASGAGGRRRASQHHDPVGGGRLAVRGNARCTDRQKRFIAELIAEYGARTTQSKELAACHLERFADQRMPANFNSLLKEIHYPLTLSRAVGCQVEDVDGNTYVDLDGDFGVNIFGHSPAFLVEAMQDQLERGIALTARYPEAAEAAELFCRMTGHDRVTFCQSGTEAVMSAVRLARAFTGRDRIAVFRGSYHGHADSFLDSFTPGVPAGAGAEMLVLDYGDPAALSAIRRHGDELAAVLVEPVQSDQLHLKPVELLRELRSLATHLGILLIMDEMITGFRVHPQGCQGEFGIPADLATYGKILGGGLTAGAVAGRADVMQWVDGGVWRYCDASKPQSATYIAGTHTQNPLKMAATLAVLRRLEAAGGELQASLNAATADLVTAINRYTEARRVPLEAVSFGSQFRFRFHARGFTLTQAIFPYLLNLRGVKYSLHGNCFLTTAHTDDDIVHVFRAVCDSVRVLLEAEFFYEDANSPAQSDPKLVLPTPAEVPRESAADSNDDQDRRRGAEHHDRLPAVVLDPSLTSRVVETVKTIVGEFLELDGEEFEVHDDLADLGVDSIIMMGITRQLSTVFDCRLEVRLFTGVSTVEGIGRLLMEEQPELVSRYFGSPVRTPGSRENDGALREPQAKAVATAAADAPTRAGGSADETPHRRRAEPVATSTDGDAGAGGVAIVGMSGVFPGADSIQSLWNNLLDGTCAITEVPPERWDWRAVNSEHPQVPRWGAFIDNPAHFDPLLFQISPKEARHMDPQERLLLKETFRALGDAGIRASELSSSATGVFIGYEFDEYSDHVERQYGLDPTLRPESAFCCNRPYYLANRISFTFDLRGPSEAININCASSAASFHRAVQALHNGECERAIVGGVALNLFPDSFVRAGTLLSPDGRCGVFDEQANGFVKGEGCAVVVLEALDRARRAGRPVYAAVRSVHQSFSGRGKSLSDVSAQGMAEAIAGCYQRAGAAVDSVGYVEVDGYSTRQGDALEHQALASVLGSGAAPCALGSIKGNIGHLEPASGIASIIKVALSLAAGEIPATTTVNRLSPDLQRTDQLTVLTANTPLEALRRLPGTPLRAGISSFADSGVNVHVLLEQVPALEPTGESASGPFLFVLSARTSTAFDANLAAWSRYLKANPGIDPARLARSMWRREPLRYRFACMATKIEDLVTALDAAITGEACAWLRTGIATADQATGFPVPAEGDLRHAAEAWVAGAAVSWLEDDQNTGARLLEQLPPYQFADKRFWLSAAPAESEATVPGEPSVESRSGEFPQAEREPAVTAVKQPVASERPAAAAPAASVGGSHVPADLASVVRHVKALVEGLLELEADDELDDRASFAEMGLTSITIVEFVDALNRDFSLALPETTAFDYPTIETLAQHIAGAGADGQEVAEVADAEVSAVAVSGHPSTGTGGAAGRWRSIESILEDLEQHEPAAVLGEAIGEA